MNHDISFGKMTGCDLDYRHSLTSGSKEDCLFGTWSKPALGHTSSFLSNRCRGLLLRELIGWNVKLTADQRLVLRLGMSAALLPLTTRLNGVVPDYKHPPV
jgi:hypothetical protein